MFNYHVSNVNIYLRRQRREGEFAIFILNNKRLFFKNSLATPHVPRWTLTDSCGEM